MKNRSILMMVILTIVTFGIYGLYWYVVFQDELKQQTGEGFGGLGHLLVTLVTFGIYGIYWQYAAGKRLAKQGADDWSIFYLILPFIGGLGALNPFLMQHQANKL
jgi:hypothetical protein